MRNSLALAFLLAACTGSDPGHVNLPPNGGIHPPPPQTGQVPTTAFSFGAGTYYIAGPATPGSFDVTSAPVVDPNQDPASYGTGDYNVALTTTYSGALSSLAMPFDQYLVFGGYNIYTTAAGDQMDQVVAIVKASDFAVGGTVALDGVDRTAMFGTGSPNDPEPSLMAMATTGAVTFTAGSAAIGGTLTASVSGDFSVVQTTPPPPPTGTITPGAYTLAIDPTADVYCDGSLAGHEADFAGITASSLALAGGTVAVATPSSSQVTVDGAVIATAFGASPFALDLDASGGFFAGITNQTGSGPDATTLVGKFFAADATSASPSLVYAAAGAGYVTADQSGSCSVSFSATLAM
jgi:hypothetical protein